MKKWKIGVVLLLLTVVCSVPVSVSAATTEQREECKQIMMEMLRTAETEAQNISRYRMTGAEIDELFAEIRHGDGAELCGGYYPATDFIYTCSVFGGYVRSIQLTNINEDALVRYEQMVPVVDSIIAGLEEDMSDLDKVIYLHDTIVSMTDYQVLDSKTIFTASGVFLERKAVCAGYAKAFNVLLRRIGLETSYVASESLNHGWSYVKLDGQWYHVDPTWDDTRTPVAGKVSRANLLRNDEEFSKNHSTWEVKVVDEPSESAEYEEWLVHDIVGEMIFENGLWYCLDTKNRTVIAVDAVNNSKEALFDYSGLGSVTLVDVAEDQIILKVNGVETGRTVEQWIIASEEAKEAVQITPDGGTVFSLDFSDIAYWRTGHYDASCGAYSLNKTRICLNDLIENTCDQYAVTIGAEDYKVVIVEYNERKKIIGFAELGDGEIYVPSEGTLYLGVSIFNSVQSKGITFDVYEEMFANGLLVGFNLCPEEEEVQEEPGNETGEIYPMDFSDIAYWRTGHYDAICGAYSLNKTRVCLNDLIENTRDQYAVTIGAEDYKVIIVEYNERKKIIGSAELGDGEIYVPSEGTVYLGVSIFNSVQSDWRITFATYEEMFANGLTVGFNLCPEKEEPEIETEVEKIPEVEETPEAESVPEESGNEMEEIYPMDFSDIMFWKTGHYDATYGAYCLNRTRICLNELIENMQEQYVVTIGAEDYKIAIVEYNERQKISGFVELGDGEIYVPSEGTVYLGVSIFNSVQSDWRISFATYEEMFANGLTVGFNLGVEE